MIEKKEREKQRKEEYQVKDLEIFDGVVRVLQAQLPRLFRKSYFWFIFEIELRRAVVGVWIDLTVLKILVLQVKNVLFDLLEVVRELAELFEKNSISPNNCQQNHFLLLILTN